MMAPWIKSIESDNVDSIGFFKEALTILTLKSCSTKIVP